MKILAFLLLLLPTDSSAAYLEYTLNNGTRDVLSFIAPDYLTAYPSDALPPGATSQWTLVGSQMRVDPCRNGRPGAVSCEIKIREYEVGGVQLRADERYQDGSTDNLLLGFPFFPVALDQIGSSRMGNATFSIALTEEAPTFAPEPPAWGLCALAGCLLSYSARLRRGKTVHN